MSRFSEVRIDVRSSAPIGAVALIQRLNRTAISGPHPAALRQGAMAFPHFQISATPKESIC